MTWMAGYIRSILPVGLLGYTRTGRMAPESPMVRLNWTREGLSSQARACSGHPRTYRASPAWPARMLTPGSPRPAVTVRRTRHRLDGCTHPNKWDHPLS